jgi:hypothetical protein
MPEFYREAIMAATYNAQQPPIDELEDWPQVAAALEGLTPSQRCDAIYADWLLRLHQPGGADSIQIRDLLLGQGALAADFLAELAQNADDSKASSLLVSLEDDWLLVANNGQPLSALNLLGLCRFFIHSDGKIVGLTRDSIGRFGIGFKACHRVAEEVLVWSWSKGEEFGFRLPICHGGGERAMPDEAKLKALLRRLADAGRPISQPRQMHAHPPA